jgi:hypothetical protein
VIDPAAWKKIAEVRELVEVVRALGATECDQGEYGYGGKWFMVQWGWLRWTPRGSRGYCGQGGEKCIWLPHRPRSGCVVKAEGAGTDEL